MKLDVEKFLAHYASEFYDPQKAHDYYLRTRELKNKASATALTSNKQKSAWAVANDSIKTAKANDLNKAGDAAQQAAEQAQADAKAASERIQAKLTDFLQQVMSDTPIPATASPQLKAFLQSQRTRRAQGAVKEANADLQAVGAQLKAAIASARQALASSKQAINDKYEQATLKEHENIRTKISGVDPKASKSKAKSRSKSRRSSSKSKKKSKASDGVKKYVAPAAKKRSEPSIVRKQGKQTSAAVKRRRFVSAISSKRR